MSKSETPKIDDVKRLRAAARAVDHSEVMACGYVFMAILYGSISIVCIPHVRTVNVAIAWFTTSFVLSIWAVFSVCMVIRKRKKVVVAVIKEQAKEDV